MTAGSAWAFSHTTAPLATAHAGEPSPITEPPPPTGCTRQGGTLRSHGHRDRKRIALTFDDGPGPLTARFVRVLDRMNASATFFVVGEEVRGRSRVMRRLLAEGNELGNHTTHHSFRGAADLKRTQRLIENATGFRPCLFRPPGGHVSRHVVNTANDLEMTTVKWDVDPRDWSTPGADTIRARVLGAARPGSIAVLHDGGGNRSGTLAALPGIIHRLRARGYELVTATEILGGEMVYPSAGEAAGL